MTNSASDLPSEVVDLTSTSLRALRDRPSSVLDRAVHRTIAGVRLGEHDDAVQSQRD
ncbi:hypothetical protein ACFFQW_24765 [Umezawaea endophytica]|uniref:FXSXX-COOH protein n=1 Tax=Umezawaea endophytica TaxID=1654476 RepID=A0A9X2VFS6_9PSEU|nr:hypothetical protein [Umezawaea endophytica]MCS7475775.1 hypothetical protein [Umezawaea endophytica]